MVIFLLFFISRMVLVIRFFLLIIKYVVLSLFDFSGVKFLYFV